MLINLDKLKQALDIESEYRYIDIQGRQKTFSQFIKSEIKKEMKNSKSNPRWAILYETFDVYPYSGVAERRRAIEQLIKIVKLELKRENMSKKNPSK